MTSTSAAVVDLQTLDFRERRWSFVARSDGPEPLFVKVPKASARTALGAALRGPEELRLARNEFDTLRALAAYDTEDTAVIPAVALFEDAPVVVTRLVVGLTPLSDVLGRSVRQWSPLLRRLGAWLRNVHAHEPGKNIDGFNVSNVGLDGDRLVVFDPNELVDGDPADDLARFCVSLLSLGYEKGRLPAAVGVEQSWALLAGYGLDAIDAHTLDHALARWIDRLCNEIGTAARWRLSLLHDLLRPFASLYRGRIDQLRLRLVERVLSDSGSGQEMDGRYDTDVAATKYLSQHAAVTARRLRPALLARAEVRAIARALQVAKPRTRVLDVPAGTGKLFDLLAGFGVPVVGVDASPEMLANAPRVPGVDMLQADVRKLPFEGDYFDVAVSLRLFHRLPPRDRRAALSELARVSSCWLIASYASLSGALRMRYWLVSRFRGSTSWAPHPVTNEQLQIELGLAGLELVSRFPVAGLLSNEIVIVARRAEASRL